MHASDVAWVAGGFCLLVATASQAEPTAGALARTCQAALDAGYRGPDAAACDWFIDPCGVCDNEDPAPRWCPPADLTGASRARVVVQAIAAREDAEHTAASEAVAEILSTRFPCPREDRP